MLVQYCIFKDSILIKEIICLKRPLQDQTFYRKCYIKFNHIKLNKNFDYLFIRVVPNKALLFEKLIKLALPLEFV